MSKITTLEEGYRVISDNQHLGEMLTESEARLLLIEAGADPEFAQYVVDCWIKGDNDVPYEPEGDGMTDVEADADALRNIGWGTDEDYGYADEVL
jgi:hypothetical protein